MKKNMKNDECLIPSPEDFARVLRDEPEEPRLPRCAICGEAVHVKRHLKMSHHRRRKVSHFIAYKI